MHYVSPLRRTLRKLLWALASVSVSLVSTVHAVRASSTMPLAPDWAKDLIIYEIAPKSFTSPNGPESGTFESMRAKLPYLQDLGINGIWMTGHSLADPKHFFNVWTQYAVIEPDKIDPSLGTPEQLKALVDDARARGIRVFLDVVTHGVMPHSPLVERKPQWFRGGSWGMVDYDWKGGHTDLDNWWVDLWTDYVTRYGISGFRLDVLTYRPDLWARIRENAAAAGQPIVIIPELESPTPGVHDFSQTGSTIGEGITDRFTSMAEDLPAAYRMRQVAGRADYLIDVTYVDESKASGSTRGGGDFSVERKGFTVDRRSFHPQPLAGECELLLSVTGAARKLIKAATVTQLDEKGGPTEERWVMSSPFATGKAAKVEGSGPSYNIFLLPFFAPSLSVQLSSHDTGGWGFPLNKNPYVAEGSRAVFGYAFMMSPAIPIFMAGEEFNATNRPLPTLSPDVYGGRDPGKGRWLYGSMLDWSEIDKPGHRAMLEDVKRMIELRKQEAALLSPRLGDLSEPDVIAVPFKADIKVPAPYMRGTGGRALIVLANRDTVRDVRTELDVPLEKFGSGNVAWYKVTDLWNGAKARIVSSDALAKYVYTVKADKTPRGGFGLLKIEALEDGLLKGE